MPVEQQLVLLSFLIEKILAPEDAAREITRIRGLVSANPHCANAFLTEAIRQWRSAAAKAEATRIEAQYGRGLL